MEGLTPTQTLRVNTLLANNRIEEALKVIPEKKLLPEDAAYMAWISGQINPDVEKVTLENIKNHLVQEYGGIKGISSFNQFVSKYAKADVKKNVEDWWTRIKQSVGLAPSLEAPKKMKQAKKEVDRQYSKSRNKTRIVFSDGSIKMVDGDQRNK
jgi:hypothetical protein